jgi:Spy/CpxP family protein refolding chaperone
MSVRAKSSLGKLAGQGQVVRKDGTVETFTINTDLTQEQTDQIEMHMQKEKAESQEQTKK